MLIFKCFHCFKLSIPVQAVPEHHQSMLQSRCIVLVWIRFIATASTRIGNTFVSHCQLRTCLLKRKPLLIVLVRWCSTESFPYKLSYPKILKTFGFIWKFSTVFKLFTPIRAYQVWLHFPSHFTLKQVVQGVVFLPSQLWSKTERTIM